MSRLGLSKLPKRLRAGLASLLLAPLLASCAGASAGLGTSAGTCFTALPAAYKAVGSQAKFVGVRIFAEATVRSVMDGLPRSPKQSYCVLAFQLPDKNGAFKVKRVDDRVFGNFDLVAYSPTEKRVVKEYKRESLPFRFAHEVSII